ncbi:hypothetical protein BKA62DRAFT_80225 [Auriculariales sp. MPI-PUGE-AT-0066]|nr:hypothetical protein BKA62DRAFT_80225 [Auriculariales sp. MPI-PUGE-AT-0066]
MPDSKKAIDNTAGRQHVATNRTQDRFDSSIGPPVDERPPDIPEARSPISPIEGSGRVLRVYNPDGSMVVDKTGEWDTWARNKWRKRSHGTCRTHPRLVFIPGATSATLHHTAPCLSVLLVAEIIHYLLKSCSHRSARRHPHTTTTTGPNVPQPTPSQSQRLKTCSGNECWLGTLQQRHEDHQRSVFGLLDGCTRAYRETLPGVRAHLLQHLDLKAIFTRLCEDEEKATKEAQLYKSIDDFLGEISKALVKYATSRGDTQLSFGREGRVEWVRHEQSSLRADSMNADVRPDHATVMVASGEEAADVIAFWQQSPGVSESKRKKRHGAGQQKTYAETHMMYRIDYPIVRGFMFDVVPTEGKPTHKTGRLRLTAMNAQGFGCRQMPRLTSSTCGSFMSVRRTRRTLRGSGRPSPFVKATKFFTTSTCSMNR